MRVARTVARFGPIIWRGAELIVVLLAVLMLGQFVRNEVPSPSSFSYFRITDLVVEGNREVSTPTIIKSLELPGRASIFEIDLRDLSARILRNPWIKTASVNRRLPGTLLIRVSERRPLAIVVTDRGYLVGEDGVVLKEARPEGTSRLPLLGLTVDQPLQAGGRIDFPRLEQGTRLWQQFHAHNFGPGVRASEVRRERDGSYIVFLGQNMPYLRFREETMRVQLDRLTSVLRVRGIGLPELEYADLRFPDKVIVKPLLKGGDA
jgi:hypothetical protein